MNDRVHGDGQLLQLTEMDECIPLEKMATLNVVKLLAVWVRD
jgi:hypothetical protein